MRILGLILATMMMTGCMTSGQDIRGNHVVSDFGQSNFLRPSFTFGELWKCSSVTEPFDEKVLSNHDEGLWEHTVEYTAICNDAVTIQKVKAVQPGVFGQFFGGISRMLGYGAIGWGLSKSGNDIDNTTNTTQQGGGANSGSYSSSKAAAAANAKANARLSNRNDNRNTNTNNNGPAPMPMMPMGGGD